MADEYVPFDEEVIRDNKEAIQRIKAAFSEAERHVDKMNVLALVRELGPVITALVVAGRVGAAIAAEIGTMQVTEQIDALRALAYSPIKYLVVPRFLALIFMLPLLTVYADAIGIFGGFMLGVYKLDITRGMYLNITFEAVLYKDLFIGLFKSLIFGIIIDQPFP